MLEVLAKLRLVAMEMLLVSERQAPVALEMPLVSERQALVVMETQEPQASVISKLGVSALAVPMVFLE